MEIRDYLLSWDEYNKKEFKVPYVFRIENEKQLLIYFGAKHTNNINDPQFEYIRKEWEVFLGNNNDKKIVFLEGGHGEDKYSNEDDSIERHGEAGLTAFLSGKENIDIISPESSWSQMMNDLSKRYTKDDILYNKAGKVLAQWNRQIKKPDPKEYVEKFMKRDCVNAGWEIFKYENLQQVHKNLFQTDLDPNDENHFYKHVAPNSFNSVINEISREENIYRDSAVVEKAIEYWNKGYSIFITYGSSHAVIQEPALKNYLK